MPRRARKIVAGWYYHVVTRGNNRAQVFHEACDYQRFVDLISEARNVAPVDLLAACLMPNHFHLVVRPEASPDLAKWVHWLLTKHAGKHHRRQGSSGRIWQGRFKTFAIQDDGHLTTVMRYVERNALRANLVERAEAWRWGSLAWRTAGSAGPRLTNPPVELPKHWIRYVNEPQSSAELAELRVCANRQRPFGGPDWTSCAVRRLGLASSIRRPGRPAGNRDPGK
jgi:putative transposase